MIAAHHVFQAGVRTSHGIAALTCGIGPLPFNLSGARDFGNLPLRCLPDVLRDANFNTRLYYGAALSFDNMNDYFHLHGMRTYGEHYFPAGLPKGGAYPT